MNRRIIAIGFLAAQLVVSAPAGQSPSGPSANSPASPADAERRDLIIATQQAAGSPIDFVRALEEHLKKYPNSPYRDKIVRSLFQASEKLEDQRRIALYGEQLLAKDPNDISVLSAVGAALNSFDDPKASERALAIGQRLEKDIRSQAEDKAEPAAGGKAQQQLEHAHDLGVALTIQADAYGITQRPQEAVSAAQTAFRTFPSAEAARSLARWEAAIGHDKAAIRAYADAFALGDSAAHHADDRRRLAELYLKDHKNTTGLGDIVLTEYDRMIALQEALEPQSASAAGPTHLENTAILNLSGQPVPLSSFKGKIVVMDFWATWCHPCRIQHPLFEQVKDSFKDDHRVVFLEVDAGEDRDTVLPFLKKQSWSSDAYLDNDLTHTLNIENIPTTVLLDRRGELYSEMIGFRPETFVALLTSRIQEALASKEPEPPARPKVN